MLTNKLILDYILKIERKLNQNEFIVDGLNYWPAIRIKFAFNLMLIIHQFRLHKFALFHLPHFHNTKLASHLCLTTKELELFCSQFIFYITFYFHFYFKLFFV